MCGGHAYDNYGRLININTIQWCNTETICWKLLNFVPKTHMQTSHVWIQQIGTVKVDEPLLTQCILTSLVCKSQQVHLQCTYLRNKNILMCDINIKVAKSSSQLKEARNLFLSLRWTKREIEYCQGNLEEHLGPLEKEHVPHSEHSSPRKRPAHMTDNRWHVMCVCVSGGAGGRQRELTVRIHSWTIPYSRAWGQDLSWIVDYLLGREEV